MRWVSATLQLPELTVIAFVMAAMMPGVPFWLIWLAIICPRGGLTTKTHLACEQGQKPLPVLITAGQRGDSPQFSPPVPRDRPAALTGAPASSTGP
jgi:hypothetical protein